MPAGAWAMLAKNPNAQVQIERRMRNMEIGSVDPRKLFSASELADKEALVAALEKRLLQAKLKPKQETVLRDYLDSQGELTDQAILNSIRLVMSTPEYQLT